MKKALTLIFGMILVILVGIVVSAFIPIYDKYTADGFVTEVNNRGELTFGIMKEQNDGRYRVVTNNISSYDSNSKIVIDYIMYKDSDINIVFYENKNPIKQCLYNMFSRTADKIRFGG